MTDQYAAARMNPSKSRCNVLLFLLFLTGAALGCLLIWRFGLQGRLFSGILDKPDLNAALEAYDAGAVLLWNTKFLLLVYLLAFVKWGAMLIPPVFGLEGLLLGGAVCSVISYMGLQGAVCLILVLSARLLLVLPYGFLLGGWAVEQSLDFEGPWDRKNRLGVLMITLIVIAVASFLECTLARWLGGMYYLKVGV